MEGGDCSKVRKEMHAQLHEYMDEEIDSRKLRMQYAKECGESNTLWDLITPCAESAFVRFFKLSGPDAVRMKGRGRVEIQVKPIEAQTRTMQSMTCRAMELKRAAGGHAAQANRLTNVARRMMKLSSGDACREVNGQTNENTIAAYVKGMLKLKECMKHEGECEDEVAIASRKVAEDSIEALKVFALMNRCMLLEFSELHDGIVRWPRSWGLPSSPTTGNCKSKQTRTARRV